MKFAGLTIGSSSPTPVPEYAAEGETARVYHEIRQSLRVTGVNLIFRTLAGFEKFFPAAWDGLRPNVETTAFDQSADELREVGVQAASSLFQPASCDDGRVGESRAYQIRADIELYHYVNPKLLVITSALVQALQGGVVVGRSSGQSERAPRGEPAKMYPMEMEEDPPDEKFLRQIFRDIQKTLSLPSINSDYRTLGLWPDYLACAWNRLKPLCQSPAFLHAADQLRERGRTVAKRLPYPLTLTLGRVRELGEDPDRVLETVQKFEQLLPGVILNIAILRQDWEQGVARGVAAEKVASDITEPAWRSFQKRQHVMEWGDEFVSYIDEGEGEPVLLLHGIPTWGFLWEKTIAALSSRYRVLVPDLLGYGYSSKHDDFDRSIARQTGMVDGFLSKLNISSVHLVGHDVGGGVALQLATLFPPRVRSLCVMNSVCYDSWPIEAMVQLGLPGSARKIAPEKTLKTLQKGMTAGFHQTPDSTWLDGLFSPWRTEVGRLSLVRNAAALNTNNTTEITRLLPNIHVPSLVMWGENDVFLPVTYGEWLARDIPEANFLRIADARHFVMVDQPDRVNRALQDFLNHAVSASAGHPDESFQRKAA